MSDDSNQTPAQHTPAQIFSPFTPVGEQQPQQQQQQQPQAPQLPQPDPLLNSLFNNIIAQQQHLQTLLNELAQRQRDYQQHTDQQLTTIQTSQNTLTTRINDVRQDQATQATNINNNNAQVNARIQNLQQEVHTIQAMQQHQNQQITSLQSQPPAASPITLSRADVQNAITDGLIAFTSTQGATPLPAAATTGPTPAQQATQGQPPTYALTTSAPAPAAQNKKLMLGSVLFWHVNPDDLPPSAVENYQFVQDKEHQSWTKKNTLSALPLATLGSQTV